MTAPPTIATSQGEAEARAEALAGRLFESTISVMELAAIHIGDRLGLFAALAAGGPATSTELAGRTGTDERYVREWLEQLAVAGILTVDDPALGPRERAYELPPGHDVVLLDGDSLAYSTPMATLTVGVLRPLEQLIEAFRTGGGVEYAEYGEITHAGIAAMNRPQFLHELADVWMPALPDVDARLREQPGTHVADVGCGQGWSAITLARAYPDARIDGFDLDGPSIAQARANAADAGVADRVRFFVQDAADADLEGTYGLVTIFEALHDMAHPVAALRTARRLLDDRGVVLVAEPFGADRFGAPGNELERFLYGCSVLHCLAVARCEHDSAATGTVVRPEIVRAYADEAGFTSVEVLPVENEFWRFYRLER